MRDCTGVGIVSAKDIRGFKVASFPGDAETFLLDMDGFEVRTIWDGTLGLRAKPIRRGCERRWEESLVVDIRLGFLVVFGDSHRIGCSGNSSLMMS